MQTITLKEALNNPLNISNTIKASAEVPIEYTDSVDSSLDGEVYNRGILIYET